MCNVWNILNLSAFQHNNYTPSQDQRARRAERSVMTSSFTFKLPAFLPAGAVVSLVALVVIAPPGAEGGCSHLVTSRTDQARISSLVDPLIRDLSGRSDPLPIPRPPRPCSGAWCSGQPATPVVPAGQFDGPSESWAWCSSAPGSALAGRSFLPSATTAPRPVHTQTGVFHPPRVLLPA
jgi:hypothetical protein